MSVFSLTNEILTAADIRSADFSAEAYSLAAARPTTYVAEPSGSSSKAAGQTGLDKGSTCKVCGIGISSPGFTDTQEQRQHFKTDWHRFNVRRVSVQKRAAITEEEWEKMLEQDAEVESISGSDTSDSETEEEEQPRAVVGRSKNPQSIFKAADGSHFAVWRCLLAQDQVKNSEPPSADQLMHELKCLSCTTPTWVVVLLRGGHFAAAIFKAKQPPASIKAKGGKGAQQAQAQDQEAKRTSAGALAGDGDAAGAGAEGLAEAGAKPRAVSLTQAEALVESSSLLPFADCFEVLDHKTFHRYVVRCGAGGKQSTKDASGKFARSAGSRLRRYNEAALDKEIHELLGVTWKAALAAADLIFVHAPASNARSVFTAKDGSGGGVLSPLDVRIRRIPFATQRPTFSEAKRVVRLLAAVILVDNDTLAPPAAEARDAAPKASKQSCFIPEAPAKQPDQAPYKPDKQQQVEDSPLHKASKAGDAPRVAQLLDNGHDPCEHDSRGRTPYVVAANKDVRDAFRRFMAKSDPDLWDWEAAGIPSALTEDLEAAQQAKKEAKKAKQKAKEKERKVAAEEKKKKKSKEEEAAAFGDEIAKAAAEAAALASRLNSAKLGGDKVGGGGTGSGSNRAGSGGKQAGSARGGKGPAASVPAPQPLTPEEMAARRERQAAAAEARMKALQLQAQAQKLW